MRSYDELLGDEFEEPIDCFLIRDGPAKGSEGFGAPTSYHGVMDDEVEKAN